MKNACSLYGKGWPKKDINHAMKYFSSAKTKPDESDSNSSDDDDVDDPHKLFRRIETQEAIARISLRSSFLPSFRNIACLHVLFEFQKIGTLIL